MNCSECGEALDIADIVDGNVRYHCRNDHWFELNRSRGWLPIARPEGWVDPNATGFPEDEE